jgi:plasmid stabilization system protein ParE
MKDEHSNGSAIGGRAFGSGGASGAQRSGPEEAARVWRRLRAYLDTLCETGRAVDRVPGRDESGHDKGPALNLWADHVDEAVARLIESRDLARAQAIDEARGRDAQKAAPVPAEETSETRRARSTRTPDSSPGHKR